jgi:hypothetical protein
VITDNILSTKIILVLVRLIELVIVVVMRIIKRKIDEILYTWQIHNSLIHINFHMILKSIQKSPSDSKVLTCYED